MPAQPCAKPDSLWSAIAELSGEQLHTIIDIAQRSPKATTDMASFRARILGVFGNVAGFETTPPSEPMLQELWERYRCSIKSAQS
ncbi:hypothetical protein JJQ59_08450 [Cupriavidus necator]|uniref:hypothetical protein n=1 Tax=Cupriavidus necator TaxID=106590 RepID=UPI0011BDE149|nr:hypothetical protein [Cupriavidus necator]QQX85922.1 hypothetical protein JJQ59_08450 [Cupriavidus necator]